MANIVNLFPEQFTTSSPHPRSSAKAAQSPATLRQALLDFLSPNAGGVSPSQPGAARTARPDPPAPVQARPDRNGHIYIWVYSFDPAGYRSTQPVSRPHPGLRGESTA